MSRKTVSYTHLDVYKRQVDRVMHNRGEVSEATLKKVQKVLKEIDYHPNMFAIGLAAMYPLMCESCPMYFNARAPSMFKSTKM